MTRERERRPGTSGAASTTSTAPSNDKPERTSVAPLPVVSGIELLPIGGAQYSRVNVEHDDCGHVHTHIKFEAGAESIVRSPACARHTEYRVQITETVPSVRDSSSGRAA